MFNGAFVIFSYKSNLFQIHTGVLQQASQLTTELFYYYNTALKTKIHSVKYMYQQKIIFDMHLYKIIIFNVQHRFEIVNY